MLKENILIIGSSGTVGSELARILKEQGHTVKLATSKEPKNEHQVKLNVATKEGIKEAMEQVDKAFLLAPPGFADHYGVLSPLIQEAKRQGLKKVVLMTAMGANADESSPLRRAEIELINSGLSYNILRPNWFFQNFNTFWVQGINDYKKILLPAGEAKVSFIDTRDISSVAAKLLTTDTFSNEEIDITGPEAINHHEVANAISSVIDEKIIYEEIEPEVLKAGLIEAGLPKDYVDFLLLIMGFLKEGYNSSINNNVEKILGRKPLNVTNYTNDFKNSWKVNG